MASKNSATLSLPKSRTVRGYEIRKMPIGAFLEACSLLEELPGTALRLLFPEKKEGDILAELAGLDKDKLQELFALLEPRRERSLIVYCATRKTTEALTDTLNQMGHPAVAYHGGMSPDAREAAQRDFITDKVPVVVANRVPLCFGIASVSLPPVRKIMAGAVL